MLLSSYYARYSISVAGMGFNLVDSHDTSRVLTRLGGGTLLPEPNPPREAVERLKLLSTLQFTLPGLPVVYMGDEFGIPGLKEHMEEHRYPIQWDKLSKPFNIEVLEHYKVIGRIKNNIEALHTSIIRILESSGGLLAYTRGYYDELLVIANNGDSSAVFNLPKDLAVSNWTLVYSSSSRQPTFRGEEIVVPPITALILMKQAKPTETSVTQSLTTTSINETSIGTTLQTSTTRIEALDNYRLLIFIVVLVSSISAVVLFTKQRR
jgi:1,4-alpha-glucan branching enzyme